MEMYFVRTLSGETISGKCSLKEALDIIAFYARIGIKCDKFFAGRSIFNH